MKKYEVMFIAKPLEEAEVTPIVEFISNLLTKTVQRLKKSISGANATWHIPSKNKTTVIMS